MPLDKKTSLLRASPELARLSRLAYNFDEPSGYAYDQGLDIGEANIRVVSDGDITIVAVRGSEAAAGDWATNLSTAVHDLWGVNLHGGFYRSATACLSGLRSLDLPCNNLLLCGHSQGAAVSAILYLLLRHEPAYNALGQVGFGTPRYTLGDSALLFPPNILSIQDPNDPVSQVPRKLCRAGQQVYVGDDGFTAHAGSELARLLGYAYRFLRLQWLVGKTSAANHSMAKYEERTIRAVRLLQRPSPRARV